MIGRDAKTGELFVEEVQRRPSTAVVEPIRKPTSCLLPTPDWLDFRRGVNNFTYRDRYKFSCLDDSSMKIGAHLLFIDIIYIVEYQGSADQHR
jgi:hypothetical protein